MVPKPESVAAKYAAECKAVATNSELSLTSASVVVQLKELLYLASVFSASCFVQRLKFQTFIPAALAGNGAVC